MTLETSATSVIKAPPFAKLEAAHVSECPQGIDACMQVCRETEFLALVGSHE